ncbi:hypothetical protein TorRG33x02_267520 [Trema orientale]|uniref:Uncharacterized protein n=1 Tax=Trema orientale TaxID=63057 RepID=A0A2P5CZW1_TREOI|nr:hypothetical protein TorRG33x02_267520 [Trema orientale]
MYELKSSPSLVGFYYLTACSKLGYNLVEDYKSNIGWKFQPDVSDKVITRVNTISSLLSSSKSCEKIFTKANLIACML